MDELFIVFCFKVILFGILFLVIVWFFGFLFWLFIGIYFIFFLLIFVKLVLILFLELWGIERVIFDFGVYWIVNSLISL